MYSKEEAKKLRVDFWEMFGKRCTVHPKLMYRKRKWLLYHTKIKDVALRFDISRTDAKVILEISHRSEKQRFKAYDFLERYKVIIEQDFENGLTWEFYHEREDSTKEICRIYTQMPNVDLHRQNQWPDIYNFYIENMLKLESNFMEIRDLLQDELKH